MRHWLILVFVIVGWLSSGGTAAARQDRPPIPNPSTFKCVGCPQNDDKLRAIQDELATLRERLRNIRSNQQTLGNSIARTAREIAQHTSDLAAGKPDAADALGRARTRLQDATSQFKRLNEAFLRTVREESLNELEGIKLRQQQEACRKECPDVHTSRTSSTGSTTGTQTATTPAECHDCAKLAADLKAKQDRLNHLQEELTGAVLEMATQGLEASGYLTEARNADPAAGRGVQPADFLDQEMLEFDSWTTKLQGEISKQAAEVEAAREALEKCDDTCSPPTTPISRSYLKPLMIAAGGGAIAVGAVLAGGGSTPVTTTGQVPSAPPAPPTAQQPAPAPPPTPAPPQPSCTEFSGTYSFAGTLRMPRSCFFTGTVPYFTSPISGSFVIQLDASCSGTLTTRYPNTWAFMHRVTGAVNGSTLQLRSSGSFSSTQPFGTPFSSTVELMIANNTYSGTETHTSGSCIDIYDLRDNR